MPQSSGATSCTSADAHTRGAGFSHELLLYSDGDHGFVHATLERIRAALADGAGVLVAVDDARACALARALGEQAAEVRFAGARELARNPARLIPAWREFVDAQGVGGERERPAADGGEQSAHGDGRATGERETHRALVIGEHVWPERSTAELEECERHETLVNVAFAADPAWQLVCAYDADRLEDAVIDAACANHPSLAAARASGANDRYARAHDPARALAGTLPAPAGAVSELAFAGGELSRLRRETSAWASAHGLDVDGTDDLVLAIDELAANSIRHGGGGGTLRCWRERHSLLCEVSDSGTIDAPLLGRRRPAADASSGRGVWLVNQLCDLVQIRSARGATTVRVHKRLP